MFNFSIDHISLQQGCVRVIKWPGVQESTIKWNLRKFADSSNGSEKIEKSVWLAEDTGTLPTDGFLSILSKLA